MHRILHAYFQELCVCGVGAEVKRASLITKMFCGKKRCAGSPERLLRAVFFYNGKNFCLRSGKEHHALKVYQRVRHTEPFVHYVYTENGSKNRSGGLNQLRLENKKQDCSCFPV